MFAPKDQKLKYQATKLVNARIPIPRQKSSRLQRNEPLNPTKKRKIGNAILPINLKTNISGKR